MRLLHRRTRLDRRESVQTDADTIKALNTGTPLAEPKLQAFAVFTQHAFNTRGLITNAQTAAFLAAGFNEKQIMEVVLAIAVKTLSNYSTTSFTMIWMLHLSLFASDRPLA